MMSQSVAALDLGTSHFKEANERVRAALEASDEVVLTDVFAQRYLGCAMPEGKALVIHGTPGNDMAAYLDGGRIEVFGDAQDQIGNTMNGGEIVIHGRCGDAAGYAMRGGRIFVRDGCGWRVGINMKQYDEKHPVIVIGGDAGSFLGEYMAGGTIVLLGRPGAHIACGMHGGTIYLKQRPPAHDVSDELVLRDLDERDETALSALLDAYAAHFAEDGALLPDLSLNGFCKLVPASTRPYASLYAH